MLGLDVLLSQMNFHVLSFPVKINLLLLANPAIDLNQTKIHHYGKEDIFTYL